jgi:hypothetical protein
VRPDQALLESEAVFSEHGREIARVKAALGSPQRPMDENALRRKVTGLAGESLADALDDLDRPAADLLELAGLGRPAPVVREGPGSARTGAIRLDSPQ